MNVFIIGFMLGVLAIIIAVVVLVVIAERAVKPLPPIEDPGLEVALHDIRRQRELAQFKLEGRILAREMRRDGLRQMRLLDDDPGQQR